MIQGLYRATIGPLLGIVPSLGGMKGIRNLETLLHASAYAVVWSPGCWFLYVRMATSFIVKVQGRSQGKGAISDALGA